MNTSESLVVGSLIPSPTPSLPPSLEWLEAENKELKEQNIRLIQQLARLNVELEDYDLLYMDRQILTHVLEDTTVEDDD